MSDTLILVDLPNRVSRPPFRPGCRQRQGQNGPEAGKGVFVTGFQATVILTWAPNDDDLDGNLLARNLTSEACWDSPPNGLDRVQSAAYQKDRARTKPFFEWEIDYHYDRMMEKFLAQWDGARIRDAYVYAIALPPSTTHHRLWKEAIKVETDDRGHKRPVHHHLEALQLAVDHAFTGSYASRFRPSEPPSTYSFTCGEVLRDPDYILHECRLFYQPRIDTAIHTPYHTLSLRELYNVHPNCLLFLKQSGVRLDLWTLDSNGPN